MPRTMIAPRRWNLGMSFAVPGHNARQNWIEGEEGRGLTVDCPELGDHVVVYDSLGHHHTQQLFERSELRQRRIVRKTTLSSAHLQKKGNA